jgi:fructokinase
VSPTAPSQKVRIGVDLGGTKIEAIALDAAGEELTRKRVPTPHRDYETTVRAVRDLVQAVETQVGVKGASVGVGMPGAISPATGRIKNANSTCLIGHPFDRDLAEALARPVRLQNDANCFALSEATDGAGKGAAVVFGVILGTGVGGGIVTHGRVLTGPNAIAGEWGHNPMPWPTPEEWPEGPACYCGHRGCIESCLSGPALERDYRQTGGALGLRVPEIAARAEQGEAVARACLERYEARLARALASVINLLDPDVIVLGGGVSNLDRLYEAVPRLWGPYVFSDRVDTRLRKNAHGDSSGVRGAAWLWPAK